jgi:hypothetical protein
MPSARQGGRLARRDTKSSRPPHWKAPPAYVALQTKIGQELRAHFELPRGLPHRFIALLIQLNQRQGRD